MRHIVGKTVGGLAVAMLACLALVATGSPASASVAPSGFDPLFVNIRNFQTNKCLEPASGADTAAIVEATCTNVAPESNAQIWLMHQVGTNHYQIKNALTELCFNAFDGAFNGGRVLQTECKSISNEEWNTGRQLPALTKIESRERFRDTGICIDVPGGQTQDGTAVVLFQCNGTQSQAWSMGV
jgi:Ricin-type beta-trefoil lectin domain